MDSGHLHQARSVALCHCCIRGYGHEKAPHPWRPGCLPSSSWRGNRDDHLSATGCAHMRRLGLLSAQGDRHEGVFRTLDRYDDHVRRGDRDNGSSEFGGCELSRLLWRKLVSARRAPQSNHVPPLATISGGNLPSAELSGNGVEESSLERYRVMPSRRPAITQPSLLFVSFRRISLERGQGHLSIGDYWHQQVC